MNNVTELPAASTYIEFTAGLPRGDWGFTKYAEVTEDGEEIAGLEDLPIDPAGKCARMGIESGSSVAYESFILEVSGFTLGDDCEERVVVILGRGGVAMDQYLMCRPEILEPVVTWRFRGGAAPRKLGNVIPDQGQWLYFIRNFRGEVIYIGISSNAPVRWTQHQSDKPWFNEAASFERVWYPTRDAVEFAESYLIAHYRPCYNTVHNPDKAKKKRGGGMSGAD